MECLLVSSCFAGYKTKYNGKDNYLDVINELSKKYNVNAITPIDMAPQTSSIEVVVLLTLK